MRSFALESGEELRGEALKMVEQAVSRRIETTLADVSDPLEWDVELLRQDLLMHYLLTVPCFEESGSRPATVADATAEGAIAGERAFHAKIESLGEYALQLLSLVMLNVLDEKWKDHLYDLDQLRNAIHYRSWGQKDPLLEYKQEAYTMFVDLMQDVHHTFAERFLRVQLMFEEEPQSLPPVEVIAAPPAANTVEITPTASGRRAGGSSSFRIATDRGNTAPPSPCTSEPIIWPFTVSGLMARPTSCT